MFSKIRHGGLPLSPSLRECLCAVSTCGHDPNQDWVPWAARPAPGAGGWGQDTRFQSWLCHRLPESLTLTGAQFSHLYNGAERGTFSLSHSFPSTVLSQTADKHRWEVTTRGPGLIPGLPFFLDSP